jgi:predicted ATPase
VGFPNRFSVPHGWSAFWRADHGWQDFGLEGRDRTLAFGDHRSDAIPSTAPRVAPFQRLQIARRELGLESAIAKLDKYHLLVLDDIAYVSKDQAETSVLFELIGSRYERHSLLITANQPFGEWPSVFGEPTLS